MVASNTPSNIRWDYSYQNKLSVGVGRITVLIFASVHLFHTGHAYGTQQQNNRVLRHAVDFSVCGLARWQCCSRDLLIRDRDRARDLTIRDRDKTETLGVRDQDQASKTETLDIRDRDRDRDRDLQCKSCIKTLNGVGEMKGHLTHDFTWGEPY